MACGLDIRIVRWWDPSPVFGPLSRARLDHGYGVLARLCAAAEHAPGLAGHDGPGQLAACCASGDLAGAVEAAEQLVGLGPGLMPSGDSMVSGVLLALRLLGGAISGGTRAVWLANWLSASATCYAAQRTTHAGGVAAALRRQRPGGGRGVRRAAGDGGPGAARARGRQAARGGPGRRSRLGPGGRLPRGAAAVRILTPVIVPLTGLQYEIEAGHYRATVTELGAGLRELAFRGRPVIAGYEADELPPAGAGQLLAPWPNRIDGGRYAFGGTEHHLALTEPARGNAIHGLTRWMAWTAVRHDASAVRAAQRPARPAGISVLPGNRGRVPAGGRHRAARRHHRAQPRQPGGALRHRLASRT